MARVPVLCPCGKHAVGVGFDQDGPTWSSNHPDEVVSEKDGFQVVRCAMCGILRTSEREENYETLYTEGMRYHVDEMDKIGRQHYDERFEHDFNIAWMKRIPLLLGQLRSLDVGCANGAFVLAMALNGFAAEGLEINPTMADQAAQETQCPIWTSWTQVTAPFDVITYHDVFEHVVTPRAELDRARAMLRPEGLLVLDCPDAVEVFGPSARAPHHEKPDQHLFYYTEDTLRALLVSHRFLVEAVDRPIVGKVVVYARRHDEPLAG